MPCTELDYQKPRIENQKVIYRDLELAVAEVINGEPGDIAYRLRYRNSEERYYDGDREVFSGKDLQDDPFDPFGTA